jgi:uncharacterized protein YbjT (DUF2867 family)
VILVLGATGTTGSVVLRELLDRGADVRGLTRSPEHAEQVRALGAEAAVGDLDDPASLGEAMRDVERMYLVQSLNERQAAQEINAISAAEQAGVYHVVKLSVLRESSESPVRFMRAHAQITEQLEQSSLRQTVLQCNGFMQNYLGQAEAVREGRLVSARPDARVSHLDARDAGEIAAKALAEEGFEDATYQLTGPEAISDAEIANALGAQVVAVGDDDMRGALQAAGYPEWNIDGLLELEEAYRSGAFDIVTPNVLALLGRPPRSFADFAADHADTFTAG